jgi:hypothetical protein
MVFMDNKQVKITKWDSYDLNKPIEEIGDDELRDLYFGLSFRWWKHLEQGHEHAADSAKALMIQIKRERAARRNG